MNNIEKLIRKHCSKGVDFVEIKKIAKVSSAGVDKKN